MPTNPARPVRRNPRPRTKRRALPLLALISLLAIWLGVRSGDYSGAGPRHGDHDRAAEGGTEAVERAGGTRVTAAGEARPTEPTGGAVAAVGESSVEGADPAPLYLEPGSVERPAAPGVERPAAPRFAADHEDRWWGLERQFAAAQNGADLAKIAAGIVAADEPPGQELRQRAAALRAAVVARLQQIATTAGTTARAGAVFEAAEALGAGLGAAALAPDFATALGLAGDWSPAVAAELPVGELPAGLAVEYLDSAGELQSATVVRADSQRVTIRDAAGGFPTVPRVAVRFSAARADLALDQAVAAARAGDRGLALAWLERATAIGDGPAARVAAVRELLGVI